MNSEFRVNIRCIIILDIANKFEGVTCVEVFSIFLHIEGGQHEHD